MFLWLARHTHSSLLFQASQSYGRACLQITDVDPHDSHMFQDANGVILVWEKFTDFKMQMGSS